MASAFDYREMAREYLMEAAATKDAARRRHLEGIAKLYTQTALAMDAAELNMDDNGRSSGSGKT